MLSSGVVRLGLAQFPSASVACTGSQVAEVIACVSRVTRGLVWYAADVEAPTSSFAVQRSSVPVRIGEEQECISRVRVVDQFEAGVFVGISASNENPRFRNGGLWTEDPVEVELADSVVEVRAFDTTFIEVLSCEREVLREVGRIFGAPVETCRSAADLSK
jgi:hypothetical protein